MMTISGPAYFSTWSRKIFLFKKMEKIFKLEEILKKIANDAIIQNYTNENCEKYLINLGDEFNDDLLIEFYKNIFSTQMERKNMKKMSVKMKKLEEKIIEIEDDLS